MQTAPLSPLFSPVAGGLFLGLLLNCGATRADDWVLPLETLRFKPGKGADLAASQCLSCHSSEYITTQPRLTREQWKASVTKMQAKFGALVQDSSVEALVDYLADQYGK